MTFVILTLSIVMALGITQIVTWLATGRWVPGVLMAVFLFCYPADLISIIISGDVYLTPTTYFSVQGAGSLPQAALLVVIAWLTFSLGTTIYSRQQGGTRAKDASVRAMKNELKVRSAALVILCLAANGVILDAVLSNGVEATLTLRQAVFGDNPAALIGYYALPPIAAFVFLEAINGKSARKVTLLLLFAVSLVSIFLTGSRSNLILSCLLPVAAVIWRSLTQSSGTYGRDLGRAAVVGTLGLVALFGGGWYLSEFRGTVATESVFRSTDVSQADVLVSLMSAPISFANGQTYLSGLLTLWPRSLWPDKPNPGNVVTSLILTPDRYRLTGAETTAGVLGESFVNFAWAGSAAAGLLMAGIAILCGRLARPDAPNAVWLLGLLLFLRGINIVRGDLANVAAPALITVAVWFIIYRRTKTPPAEPDEGNLLARLNRVPSARA